MGLGYVRVQRGAMLSETRRQGHKRDVIVAWQAGCQTRLRRGHDWGREPQTGTVMIADVTTGACKRTQQAIVLRLPHGQAEMLA